MAIMEDKMKMKWALAAIVLASAPLNAQNTTLVIDGYKQADQLFAECSDTQRRPHPTYVYNAASCVAYVTGLSDAVQAQTMLAFASTGTIAAPFCLEKDVRPQQLLEQVRRWMAFDPSRRKGSAALVVMSALADRWPCAG